MKETPGRDGCVRENAQKTQLDFYVSVSIIFFKPLEKSFIILYNSECNKLTDIIIYH